MPRRSLRCPECGWCPRAEAYKHLQKVDAGEVAPWLAQWDEVPKYGLEELDCFEVLGADEGNLICPRCACEFLVNNVA